MVLAEVMPIELMGWLRLLEAWLSGEHRRWRSREWFRRIGAAEVLG